MKQPGEPTAAGDGPTPAATTTTEERHAPTGPDTPPEPEAAADDPRTPEEAAAEAADLTEELTEEVGIKPPPRKAAVIYNPIKTKLDVLRAAVDAAAEAADYRDTLWLETSEDDPGESMAREAVDAGCSVVLAAGGDGTVRAVAQGLRGSSTAMALIPSGTGNLLARNLAVPVNDLEGAVSIALAGQDKPIDLGIAAFTAASGETFELVFLVMAGVGLDAQMIVNTDDDLKRKAGWLAYVQAIGRSLKGGRRIKLRYTLDDDEPRVTRVHSLMAGNCGELPGDVVLLPEAELDDGVLDIVALRPDGPLGWLSISIRVLIEHKLLRRSEIGRKMISQGGDGKPKPIRALRYLRGAKLRVQIADPEEFELDGDAVGEVTEFTTWLEDGGLTVRVAA